MIQETIEKIKKARQTVNLDYDEMIEVKKYMFEKLLRDKCDDEETIKKDIEYVNSLNTLDPNKCDRNKISNLGLAMVYKIFGGYISVVSTKFCEEDFTFTKPVCENEIGFEKYECNVGKKMYLKYKAQTVEFKQENTMEMVRQEYQLMDIFGENFYAFKLSENKAILLVNSFFRLYFDNYAERKLFLDLDITKYSEIPSFMSFAPNGVVYSDNRRYKYEIHELDLDTAEYINSLC